MKRFDFNDNNDSGPNGDSTNPSRFKITTSWFRRAQPRLNPAPKAQDPVQHPLPRSKETYLYLQREGFGNGPESDVIKACNAAFNSLYRADMDKLAESIEPKVRLAEQYKSELTTLQRKLATISPIAPDPTPVFQWPTGGIAQLCVVFLFLSYAGWWLFDWITAASYVLPDTQSWLASLGYSSVFAVAPLALKVAVSRAPKPLKPWLVGLVSIVGLSAFFGLTWYFANNYAGQSTSNSTDPLASIAPKDLRSQFACQVLVGVAVGFAILTALAHLLIVTSDSRPNPEYEVINNRALKVLSLMEVADSAVGALRGQLAAFEASREFHAEDWVSLVKGVRLFRKLHEDMFGIDGAEET